MPYYVHAQHCVTTLPDTDIDHIDSEQLLTLSPEIYY